jgi:hypothetical protein
LLFIYFIKPNTFEPAGQWKRNGSVPNRINHLFFISQTTVTLIVSIIFIVYGGIFTWVGFKKYKHYLPYAEEEAASYNAK